MKSHLILALISTTSMIHAATIVPLEDFETTNDLGPWSITGGSVLYYQHETINQPSGDSVTNFAAGGTGAVDLRKSGGTIASPTLNLNTLGADDLTIELDYVYYNGSTTRRTYVEISLDGGTSWLGLGLLQTGGGVTNLSPFGATFTLTEGSGVSRGETSKAGNRTGVSTYGGEALTDSSIIRFTNQGGAGADLRIFLDNIEVSSVTAVPEPRAVLLGGIGALALLFRRRR